MLANPAGGSRDAAPMKPRVCSDRQQLIARLCELSLSGANASRLRKEAVQVAKAATDADFVGMLRDQPRYGGMILCEGLGWNRDIADRALIESGPTTVIGYTLLNREPLILEDAKVENRFKLPFLMSNHGVKSSITMRISGVEKEYGVLGVFSKRRKAFSEEDVTFLQIVANHLALTFDRDDASRIASIAQEDTSHLFQGLPSGLVEWDFSDLAMMMHSLRGLSQNDIDDYLAGFENAGFTFVQAVQLKRANKSAIRMLGAQNAGQLKSSLATFLEPSKGEFLMQLIRHLSRNDTTPFFACLRSLDGERLSLAVQILPGAPDHLDSIYTWLVQTDKNNQLNVALRNKLLIQEKALSSARARERELVLELREVNAREKELASLKNRFVSMASHEFRTPLTAILGEAGLLKCYGDKFSDHEKQASFEKIEKEASALVRVLDNVLEVGRGGHPEVELQPVWCDLEGLCRSILHEVESEIGQFGRIEMHYQGQSDVVFLDEHCVRNILSNLLCNAVKYSPENSGVQFRIDRGVHEIDINIIDQGIGIPARERDLILEPFFRGSNVGGRPGNGLGMAIVRRSIALHGGRFSIESETGRGTTVRVRLPNVTAAGVNE